MPSRSAARRSAAPQTKPRPTTQPKRQPPYAVVLLNDRVHSFAFVVQTLRRVFGYGRVKAFRLTLRAHVTGRAHVWTGSLEVAELKREQLRAAGPDLYASVEPGPLGCELEPLPA